MSTKCRGGILGWPPEGKLIIVPKQGRTCAGIRIFGSGVLACLSGIERVSIEDRVEAPILLTGDRRSDASGSASDRPVSATPSRGVLREPEELSLEV